MASTSETGHAKNVANFEDLITFTASYGTTYNPTKATLKQAALTTLFTQVKADLATVANKNLLFNNATNARALAFEPLQKLSTRLLNAFSSTDATTEMVKDAKTINRKIQGARASKSKKPLNPNAPAPVTISTAQLSYDQQIEHLNALIELLKSETTYTPNEPDLKTATLSTLLANLKTANTNVSTSFVAVSNARIARNKTLYNAKVGTVEIAQAVKDYVKSVYGATAPEYKQIRKIQFKIVE